MNKKFCGRGEGWIKQKKEPNCSNVIGKIFVGFIASSNSLKPLSYYSSMGPDRQTIEKKQTSLKCSAK